MSDSEDEVKSHVEEERRAVLAKYDLGREEGAQVIDDWEDPALEVYHVTDRYGFIHDRVLPRRKVEETKLIQIEQERVAKWLKMTKEWGKYGQSEKLRKRTYKGIPDRVRPLTWGLILEVHALREQQKGKYQEMYELARKYSPDVRQIDLDVNRTYRDTLMFRERFGKQQKSLFNILLAYSIYNSEVGYCQGMSQVAALLLMYLQEEDAFWGLAQLMTNHKYGMHGFFIAGFPKLVRFQAHHDKVMQVMLPRLKKHFDKHGVDSGLYTLKWFFQCFLDRVPFELSLRFWDIYLLEGDRVLICGAYSILKMHSKQLLARKNMDDILNYIQTQIPSNFGMDCDKAMLNYQEFSVELARKKLDSAGEPTDEELPKKPFGVIEPKPRPVKIDVPKNRLTPSPNPSPVPPPPVPSPVPVSHMPTVEATSSENLVNQNQNQHPPTVGHQLIDHTRSSKRVPPPVSPRRGPIGGNTTKVSTAIDGQGQNIPSVGSSNDQTLRIRVPYNSRNNSTQLQPLKHSVKTHPATTPRPETPRNGCEVGSKNDPNRIKIDVSSHTHVI